MSVQKRPYVKAPRVNASFVEAPLFVMASVRKVPQRKIISVCESISVQENLCVKVSLCENNTSV